MKKFILILAVVLMVLLVVSCDKKAVESEPEGMYIKPHIFSDGENKIINYLDAELKLWDIKLSDEIKSYELETIIYKNGKFQRGSTSAVNTTTNDYKFGFSQRDNKYFIIEVSESSESVKTSDEPIIFPEMATEETFLDKKVNIENGKEIVLYSKIGYKEGKERAVKDSKDYKNLNCDTGIIIIAKFTDKVVDDERGE